MLPAVNYHVDTLWNTGCYIFAQISLILSIIYVSGSFSGQILYTSFMIVALHMNVLNQSDSTATTHIVIMKTAWQ